MIANHLTVIRAAQAKADQHNRTPRMESGQYPEGHHHVLQTIFREAHESGIAVRDNCRERIAALTPLVEAKVRAQLAPLNLAPRNAASPEENRRLDFAIKHDLLPMTPEARTLFNIGGLISECNTVEDLGRHLEAVELLSSLEKELGIADSNAS
jgi:hypothetical protein